MYYADYHVHSCFSMDSNQDVEEIINTAINLGLKEIAITDHFEWDIIGVDDDYYIDLPKYTEAILAYIDKYKDKIKIKLGIEAGVQTHLLDFFKTELKKYPFDFIIASTHAINRYDLYVCKLQKDGLTKEEVQDLYFNYLLKIVKDFDYYSVIGHLDFVTRYGGPKYAGLNYDREKELIDEILSTIIRKGKGIEINTSGYRYKEDRFYPMKNIVKRYFELGGEIITIGSDAHKASDITKEFNYAYDFLKEIGIKYITTYDKLIPTMHKI